MILNGRMRKGSVSIGIATVRDAARQALSIGLIAGQLLKPPENKKWYHRFNKSRF